MDFVDNLEAYFWKFWKITRFNFDNKKQIYMQGGVYSVH